MAVPANITLTLTFQDNRGFKSQTRVSLFANDISTGGSFAGTTVASLFNLVTDPTNGVAQAIAAMSNAKLVKIDIAFGYDYAQEPASETGTYQLVIQKAKLRLGDGNGGFNSIEIPAPKDALFLSSGTDNLIVVDPTSSLIGGGSGLQAAFTHSYTQGALGAGTVSWVTQTPRGGTFASLFNGGELIQGKPRRRRVVQGK